ncbi:hypothetical protein MAH4_19480 [Sessilibacter sp. MAH4]
MISTLPDKSDLAIYRYQSPQSHKKTNSCDDFIQQTNLDELNDKVSVIEAFFTFSQAEQIHEAQELIKPEALYFRFSKT